jgi:hypothetical protein
MTASLRKKMNSVFIFALVAMGLPISAHAQQPAVTPVSTSTTTPPTTESWVTTRKFPLEQMHQFGDTYISKSDDNGSVLPILSLGGDRTLLEEIVPALAVDYFEKLDLRFVENRSVSSGKIFVTFKKGTARRELRPGDLSEAELADETSISREAAAKWRKGEVTVESIEMWLCKVAGLATTTPQLRELTAQEYTGSLTTDKPYEVIFYRTEDAIKHDDRLTPAQRVQAWKTQVSVLADTARRAARVRPLLTVRKTSTVTTLNGVCPYDQLAAGSWQGYPVAVILRGSPIRSEREHWGPFFRASAQGREYAEELEMKTFFCLGLDALLPGADKRIAVSSTTTTSAPAAGSQTYTERKGAGSNDK